MLIKEKIHNTIDLLRTEKKIPIITPMEHKYLFSGKVALISGGSGDLGKAMAYALLNCGCKVIITGTNSNKMEKITRENKSQNLKYIVLELQKIETFKEKVEQAISFFPEKHIDILINCAGVNDNTPFLKVSEDTYDNIIDVNVKGMYFLSQEIARHMIENNVKGHILNVSSASALRPASTPYAISKWAVTGMTKGLADILIDYGITVNAIGPGPTATEMLGKREGEDINHSLSPIGRYATSQEIANLAVFMVSEMGDLIVGDTFYITGGSGTISMHR